MFFGRGAAIVESKVAVSDTGHCLCNCSIVVDRAGWRQVVGGIIGWKISSPPASKPAPPCSDGETAAGNTREAVKLVRSNVPASTLRLLLMTNIPCERGHACAFIDDKIIERRTADLRRYASVQDHCSAAWREGSALLVQLPPVVMMALAIGEDGASSYVHIARQLWHWPVVRVCSL